MIISGASALRRPSSSGSLRRWGWSTGRFQDRASSFTGEAVTTCVVVAGVKPGASVIATVADTSGKSYPAVVVQRFGHGRTAALTVGDLWRWGLHDAEAHRDMDKAWRQLMHWLVTDVPNRVELAVEPQAEQ